MQHYGKLEHEAAATLPTDPPPGSWPSSGAVSFKDVQLRYRPELPLVLRGMSFDIKPGEKVGIIGRTGAGKSSVAQALFRMVEICGGLIEVDGVDLKTVGLDTVSHRWPIQQPEELKRTQLRPRLAIIPQDSFLFSGTVKSEPFYRKTGRG